MEPLNHCRQALPTLEWNAAQHPNPKVRDECAMALQAIGKAVKFLVPDGGRVMVDPQLRALDLHERLCLPFPVIALEYRSEVGTKYIALAIERETDIELQLVLSGSSMTWTPTGRSILPREAWLRPIENTFAPNVQWLDDCPAELAEEPAFALVALLNALACANVHVERREARKVGKKAKVALPFDAYHILVVDVPSSGLGSKAGGDHRSPREHLRRGHIRRLADGRRLWINATVVAAGRGAGIVTKDYKVQAR